MAGRGALCLRGALPDPATAATGPPRTPAAEGIEADARPDPAFGARRLLRPTETQEPKAVARRPRASRWCAIAAGSRIAHVALRASRWCAIAAGSRIARLLPRSPRETPRDAKIQERRFERPLCSGRGARSLPEGRSLAPRERERARDQARGRGRIRPSRVPVAEPGPEQAEARVSPKRRPGPLRW